VRRNWIPLSASATAHLMLIAIAAALSRKPADEPRERARDASDAARHVDMIYVPPAEAPLPQPKRPAPAPPVKAQRRRELEPNAPPEATRTRGAESENPAARKGDAPTRSAPASPPAPAPRAAEIATLESEARRIFGRPHARTAPGAGPQATRPMEAYVPDDAVRCTPKPVAPRDSSEPPHLGTVVGRIYRQDSGRPLAGAHLQMLGEPYVAFTDDNGEYRFRFDLSLVDNCRTQYVRVTAPGYETRLLVLVLGENVRSEDVLLRRW
jgi:hypothetical protein